MILHVKETLRKYRFNIWALKYSDPNTGGKLNIIYIGHQFNKNYISHLAFKQKNTESYLGKIWLPKVLSIVKNGYPGFQMIICEIDESLNHYFKKYQGFYSPCWVQGVLDVSLAVGRFKTSKNIKKDIRKIRKYNLDYEVTHDKSQFDNFYYNMYVPHMNQAHGDRVSLMTHTQMLDLYDSTELLLLKRNNNIIAGRLILHEDGGWRMRKIGVKNGDKQLIKEGATAALYYFTILYAQQNNINNLFPGSSRSFLKDGVLQFKKKWGTQLNNRSNDGFWIKTFEINNSIADFLEKNPFILLNEGRLCGAIFIGSDRKLSEENMLEIDKTFNSLGLSKLFLYQCDIKLGKISTILVKDYLQ